MTPVTYARSARSDLANIKKYFGDISERTFENVMKDIRETIETIQLEPEIGNAYRPDRRRLVTTKYRYVVTYHYNGEIIKILSIYRYQNRA